MRVFFLIHLILFALSCSAQEPKKEKESAVKPLQPKGAEQADMAAEPTLPSAYNMVLVQSLEKAHRKTAFQQKGMVAFDIALYFRGQKRLEGRITASTDSKYVRLDRTDGVTVVYNGKSVYKFPAGMEYPGARFDIFTWQYFFMAPFKFSDPGTQWEPLKPAPLGELLCQRAKLTFEKGTGDSPEDWYIIYQNPETKRLHAMAYIVTFKTAKPEAEKEPHAITYSEYESVDGIPIATEWAFWGWSEKNGLGKQLGRAEITNIEFLELTPDFFKPQPGATHVPY